MYNNDSVRICTFEKMEIDWNAQIKNGKQGALRRKVNRLRFNSNVDIWEIRCLECNAHVHNGIIGHDVITHLRVIVLFLK